MDERTKTAAAALPPGDRETEKNVLGTIINNDGFFTRVEDMLDSGAFHDLRLKAVFRCVKYLIMHNMVVDANAILDTARRKAKELGVEVTDLDVIEVASCDSRQTFLQDVERIVDYGQRRRAWEAMVTGASRITSLAESADGTVEDVIRALEESRGTASSGSGIIDSAEGMRLIYEQINDNYTGLNSSTLKTGFHFSDDKGGIRLCSLVIIGAWTAVGKTTLALNIMYNAARAGIPCAYYSLEMSSTELWARMLNTQTGVPAWKTLGYPLNRDELKRIDEAQNRMAGLPIFIDDRATTTFDKMLRSVRYMVKVKGIKMFFVDYLQIFAQNMRGEREESALAEMVRALKNLCRELSIVCCALSQLHRAKDVKHPAFDMLRGSGQIEESADIIVLIDRPAAHPEWGVSSFQYNKHVDITGHAELRVVKGRNIGTGASFVGFDDTRFLFYEEDGYPDNAAPAESSEPFGEMPEEAATF